MCFQGTPQPLETYIDSKKEVDQQLKTTCEDFIRHVADDLLWALKAFLTKVHYIMSASDYQLHSRELVESQSSDAVDFSHNAVVLVSLSTRCDSLKLIFCQA